MHRARCRTEPGRRTRLWRTEASYIASSRSYSNIGNRIRDRFAAERRARVQPVLDKMYGWLRQKQDQVPPSTALGKAIAFALGQWPKLIRSLDHPQPTVGQQHLRADDPAVRDPAQELAVFR